jgi:alpha-amylase
MASICLYFQVHQPYRLKQYSFFNIGTEHYYFNDELNLKILNKVSDSCYLPTNQLLLDLINQFQGAFRLSFSISGNLIEQLEEHRPDVLESFQKLAQTRCVEFLYETYHHSIAAIYAQEEFSRQVEMHRQAILLHFNQIPKVFRNTECIYSNDIGRQLFRMGYKHVITEGVQHFLQGRSENFVFKHPEFSGLKILLRNAGLSDDISFRFSNRNWNQYPLTADKYVGWLEKLSPTADCINLFMDYETFGEHQKQDSGIFDFLSALPKTVLGTKSLNFHTPTEIFDLYPSKSVYDILNPISWADEARDMSAWQGNSMQTEALKKIYSLEPLVMQSRNKRLIALWSKFQNSDHFYYMSTKDSGDGAVHQYFSPFNSPYDAYIFYMNALADFEMILKNEI